MALFFSFTCVSVQADNSMEMRIKAIPYQAPNQSLLDYKTDVEMYYHALNYATFYCTDPHTSVLVNITAAGIPNYGAPYDDLYLKRQQEIKNCTQISPTIRFKTTNAISVYAGGFGAVWVTGIKGANGNIAGYIPVNSIQFIPIPAL